MDLKVAIGSWESPPEFNGPSYYIEELVRRLAEKIDVNLIVPSYSSIKDQNRLITRKIGTINIPILRVCMFAARASSLVNKIGADLIHDNGVLGFSSFSPFIETWHHSNKDNRQFLSNSAYYLSFYRELLTLRGIKKSNAIIAISQTAKNELINLYSIPSSKISVTPHGVDTDFFKPLGSEELANGAEKKRKIFLLYVGSLSERKNLASLLKALKILNGKQSNKHLLIVGSGNERSRLEELTNVLCLREHVTFFGAVSRDRLRNLYNIADYVVVPSYKEGFAMTALEALACEKPVIMTPVGISDVIKNNNLGVVTEGFAPENIASAIETALNSKFKNLRLFVHENFGWSKTIKATLEVYRHTLKNH